VEPFDHFRKKLGETLQTYQKDFLSFLLETGALKFGEFKTKSGRLSPYYVNTGLFDTGKKLAKLGEFYAAMIKDKFAQATLLFGPAYKGIPLVSTIGVALANHHGMDLGYAFNRKEVKDHGDGGLLVGKKMTTADQVVIVDDVITAGLSIRESRELLKHHGDPKVLGIAIAVNRLEKNVEGVDAIEELKKAGIQVEAILTIDEIIGEADKLGLLDAVLKVKIANYRQTYGS
jgi:orotate phosphoribosyltransferase